MVPVRLTVYDITGREVARLIDEVLNAGNHTIQWNASGVPSGMYIYSLTAGSFKQAKRMTVIK